MTVVDRRFSKVLALLLVAAVILVASLWWLNDTEKVSDPPVVSPSIPTDLGLTTVAVPPATDTNDSPETPELPSSVLEPPPTGTDEGPIRWILAGGGALPELNQISIEQDAQLAISRFPGPGRILFAAGTGSNTVQVQTGPLVVDELEFALGEIFQPRGGRDSTYRPVSIPNAAASTKKATLETIQTAMAQGKDPLLVTLVGHGDQGETAADNIAGMWPGDMLTVRELVTHVDKSPTQRQLRFVITTCFSGGFAELVFQNADPELGETQQNRCGLFSATWDLEASGCDPNPDRRVQEGFGLHFWNALAGRNRDGAELKPEQIDFNNDGKISLAEAHAWVRIMSASVEVPTTTSERWLRFAAPAEGKEENVDLPIETAVIVALSAKLGVNTLTEAQDQLETLQQSSQAALDKLTEAQQAEEDAYRQLAGELLARWPVLDDPYHPAYRSMLDRDHDAILALLHRHDSSQTFQDKMGEVERATMALEDSRVRSAPLHRLTRALENRQLARRLKAVGGSAWKKYEQLLRCENTVP